MTAPSSAHTPAAKFLGRYELMYLLGQGGMGEVHLARLTGVAGFEKLCIVKTILPQMMTDPQFVDRFHHEAKVLVQLNHSNIAQVYDMGDVDQTLYMAIEYVPGVDLARVEDRARSMESAFPVQVALHIGQQICEALGYAHRKLGADGTPLGIVHRDVSPQNVMVSYEGEVKVIDFGLAKSSARSKHTLPSTVLGKLGYMSPEQARADKVDHRSDIYSAGIVVWELLAGRPYINGGTVGEMVAQMASPKVQSLRDIRPEISEQVERIVQRALQPDISARYARADDFARAINEQLVREGLVVGSEDVGNYVRAMCPEEFAAERALQSRLSSLRKKGASLTNAAPAKSPVPIEGTFLRAPASSIAAGVIAPTQVRTPLPPGSSPSNPPALTAAQRAMSNVVVEDLGPGTTEPMQPAYVPGAQVGGRAGSAPGLSGEYQVPKSKAPAVVVSLFALVAAGGGGFFAWKQFLDKPQGEPLVVEPPPKKEDPVEVNKVDPALGKPDDKDVKKDPVVVAKVDPVPVEPVKVPEPKRDRIEVKGTVWKIIKDGDRYYVQVTGKPRQLERGDEVKVLGPELEKSQREVYGIATVMESERSLARILVDEDTTVPAKAFAIKETGPKGYARAQKKAAAEAARAEAAKAEAAKGEPAKADPAKTEVVAKVEPAKTEPAKTEPAKTEPAKVEPAKLDKKDDGPAEVVKPDGEKPEPSRVKPAQIVLTGRIVVTSKGKAYIFNDNDFAWHGCELWLPTKKHFKYGPDEEIQAKESDGQPVSRFDDFTQPDYPEFAKGYALVRCKEGAGYVQFKAK